MKIFDSNKFQNIKDPFADGHYVVNRKMCQLLGIWPEQKLSTRIWLQIIHVIITISVVIPEVAYFVGIYNDLDLVAQSIPTFLVIIAAGIKFFTVGFNSQLFLQAFNYVREDWIKYHKSFAQEILYKYAYRGYQGTVMYMLCIFLGIIAFLSTPMIPLFLNVINPLNESRTSFPIFETNYGIDREKWIVPITLHAYLTTVQVLGTVIAVDTLVIILVEHCCGLFIIAGLILKRLEDENHKNIEYFQYEIIREAILVHRHVIEIADFVAATFSTMYGAILILNTASISFTGFETIVLLERGEYTQVFRFVVYMLGQTLHLFLNSLPGQELLDYSDEEINIVYNCNWTSLSTRGKQLIAIILMRTFKPCTLAAGGFYVMNLENFGSVMQTSMSYLMVLASVH